MKKLIYCTPDVTVQKISKEDVLTYSVEQSGYGDSADVSKIWM